MRYRFIKAYANRFSVRRMCAVLAVSPSGYYAWRRPKPSNRARANVALLKLIRTIYTDSKGTYGYRKVHAVATKKLPCSRNRVARLMRQAGLRSQRIRRYRPTTQSGHKRPVAANVLNRDFTASAPNQKWVTDITYIPTAEGWLYLALVV